MCPDPCGPATVIGTNAVLVMLAFGVRGPAEVIFRKPQNAFAMRDARFFMEEQ
jgi:hypothetical protein